MLVIGDREAEGGLVAVRSRTAGDLGSRPLHEFVEAARQEVQRKGRSA
jgi:threonyl-tRNA synthetase